uniref:Choline/ethanolamine kinase n=1 Tax=Wuchereria bancrofti TaxID=6293 RepID=A0AAF5RTI1_WUCBA
MSVAKIPTPCELKKLFGQPNAKNEEIPYDVIVCTRELCARYLGGAWNTISPEQLRMQPIIGGISNLLFLVELPENVVPEGGEPVCSLLRIHCSDDLDRLLSEAVVFTMLSERLLGPRLFAAFPSGRFEQYIPSRPLFCDEFQYRGITKHLGKVFARIHILNVPIAKKAMVIEVANGWLEKLGDKMRHKMRLKMVQTDLSKVISLNLLKNELEIIQLCLEKSGSPIVFCHNDLQEGNILLHNQYTINENGDFDISENEDPISPIDFEYASYNYRGFEFGNYICEYMLDYGNDKSPFYWVKRERTPSDEQLYYLFNSYLDEIDKQKRNGDHFYPVKNLSLNREAEIQKLFIEARRFPAVSHLFWSIWSFCLADESLPISFDYISYGLDRIALYYECKPRLLEYLNS